MKILNKIRSLSKKSKLMVAAVTFGLAAVAIPVMVTNAGFFPDRPVYDYNKAGNGDCSDVNNPARDGGRCGSMDGPVFNSFINTPFYGDERQFTDGRRTDKPTNQNNDTITDVTEGSKEVVIRVYVHNNANATTNASGKGVAKNAKVAVELPTNSGNALQAVGVISADNAKPKEVTDTVYLTANRDFKVDYVEGSAKFLRGTDVYPLSDSVVNGGALIGDNVMNGNLPGCFAFTGFVEINVKIVPEEDHELQFTKQVREKGTKEWKKEVFTKPGDTVQWLLTTKNIGLDQITDVSVRDVLPPYVKLVEGTVRVVDGNGDFTQKNDPLFKNGINLGKYNSGGGRYVIFDTVTLGDFHKCSFRARNVALVRTAQNPNEVRSDADVVITKENCDEPTPKFVCEGLTATKTGNGREVKFTASASASGGAEIKKYVFDFGDGNSQESDSNMVTYTYGSDGNYTAKVTVKVLVNGEWKEATSRKCKAHINFNTPTSNFEIEKGVRVAGSNSAYMQDVTLEYGDTAEYQITVKNTGETKLTDVGVRDVTPAGVEYIDGTLKLNGSAISGDLFSGDGITISSIDVGQTAYVTYSAKVVKKHGVNCDLRNYRNVAYANVHNIGTKNDDANVKASCDEPTPKYSCDLLTATKTGNGREVMFSVNALASGGAEIKRYVYSFGDGSEDLVTDKANVKYTYANDGQYAARVAVQVTVNGEMKTAESDNCATSITFTTPETPETPVTPGKLPETGAGGIAAAFLATVTVSTFAFSFARRLV